MHEVSFPEHVSERSRSIIKDFLKVDAAARLGAKGDQTELRAHCFFEEINWHLIESMLAAPPYIPVAIALNDEPKYASFQDMMKEVGRDDWLTCAPPSYLDKYFNSWNYSSDLVIGTERYISQFRSTSTSMISTTPASNGHGSSSGEDVLSPIETPSNSGQRNSTMDNYAFFRERAINVLPTIMDVATPCGDSIDGSIGSRIGASGSYSMERSSFGIHRSLNKSFEVINTNHSTHSPRFDLSAVYESPGINNNSF